MDDRFEENDTPLQAYIIQNKTSADEYFEAQNTTHINRTWAFYTTILAYDGSTDYDYFTFWITTNTSLFFKILAENSSSINFELLNGSGSLINDGGSIWNKEYKCNNIGASTQGWWKLRFFASNNIQYNFSITLSSSLPKAGESVPGYNASSMASIPAGPAQIVNLNAGKVQMELNISCLSNVDISLGQWDSNPMNSTPGFDNESNSLFFAIDVSNKSAVVFPVIVKMNLTDDLLAALPKNISNDVAKNYFKFTRWNETTNKWEDSDYSISVDLADKSIKIIFKSFSIYALGIKTPEPKIDEPFSISGYPFTIMMSLAVCAVISMLIKSRKYHSKI